MHFFAYGTLQDEEVFKLITGVSAQGVFAVLDGYEARCLRDVAYPGLVARETGQTIGTLYFDLPPEVMIRLNHYEGPEYEFLHVRVKPSGSEKVKAGVYATHPDFSSLILPEIWSFDSFMKHDYATYLQGLLKGNE